MRCVTADGSGSTGRALVMGVVNVTPDSFSDGGRFVDPAAAIAYGAALIADGADLLDVGGEATNPWATPISAAEEIDRVVPVIGGLAARGFRVSIDTTKAEVARAALAAGATVVNDVSGGRFDPAIFEVAAAADAYIAGHLRGSSIAQVFAGEAGPAATWDDIAEELAAQLDRMPPALVLRTWVDPGIGFGKGADPAKNLELCRRSGELGRRLGRPVAVGPSRKRFLARLIGPPAAAPTGAPTGPDPAAQAWRLDAATVGACLIAAASGAKLLRVHNVALLRPALIAYNDR